MIIQILKKKYTDTICYSVYTLFGRTLYMHTYVIPVSEAADSFSRNFFETLY
jgi:hypothetical protein